MIAVQRQIRMAGTLCGSTTRTRWSCSRTPSPTTNFAYRNLVTSNGSNIDKGSGQSHHVSTTDEGDFVDLSSLQQTTMRDSYQEHSIHQYAAHIQCQDMLEGCMERLVQKCQFEYNSTTNGILRRRQLADLGSADGTNSLRTLQAGLMLSPTDIPIPCHVTFEEHPASTNIELLQSNLRRNEEWFQQKNITYSILRKSYYESLFPSESMDFIMSYICLHWLDTSNQDTIDWKRGGMGKQRKMNSNNHENYNYDEDLLCKFVHVQEATAPQGLQDDWNTQLATPHLAKFLELRAKELRPGAELLVMMVGHPPNHFITPPPDGLLPFNPTVPIACPLTIAMQRLVQQGSLRKQVLEDTIIPYFLRTKEDIRQAWELARTTTAGALLQLVEIRSYSVVLGGGNSTLPSPSLSEKEDSIDGIFELFWAIHGGSVIAAGGTEVEIEAIRCETRAVFEELYDPRRGLDCSFVAVLFRKRTRKAWSNKRT